MGRSIVYLAQCTLDRTKLYVGKSDRTLDERKQEHERAALKGKPTPFHRVLVEEGLKNWEWRVLEECPSETIVTRERYWIEKLGALSIDLLNVTHGRPKKPTGTVRRSTMGSKLGGMNVWKKPSAKEWMMRSGKLKPVINLSTGVKHRSLSEAANREQESRSGITKSCDTGRPTIFGNRYAWLGFDDKPLLTKGHKKELPRTIRVKNLSTGKIFTSIKEAAQAYNASISQVQAVCAGKYQTCKGMSYCYLDDDDIEQLKPSHYKYQEKKERAATTAYAAYRIEDVSFEHPYIFDTTKEISEVLKISQAHIPAICKGERQHEKGWRIAYFNKSNGEPQLTEAHRRPIKKIIRKVICLNDNKTFPSPAAAARHYDLDAQQIAQCCKGQLKSTGRGKIRRRFAYLDSNEEPILFPKHKEPLSMRRTRIFCPQLGKEYQSVAEFCRETGVPQKRARKYLEDSTVDLGGLELIQL